MIDWALILLASVVTSGQVQPSAPVAPPRDAVSRDGAAKAATATLSGRVVDRETGQPLGRVMVMLTATTWRDEELSTGAMTAQTGIAGNPDDSSLRRNEPPFAVTAADGRFVFAQVLPGAYTVTFHPSMSRGTHLDQSFGESEPRAPWQPGRRVPPIELRDGETRANVNIALWRAFAVEGRVIDDVGDPVANADVNVSLWESPSDGSIVQPRQTDDRGMFRVFGLRPGQFRICAEGGMFVGPSEEVRGRLTRTCYPSAITDADAQPVVVSSAEVGPIEIRLQRNRTFRITGMAIDSSGAPIATPSVHLVSVTPTGSSSSSASIQTKPGGQFIASGVTPGDYAIRVTTGSWPISNQEDKQDREMGYVPVRVDSEDIHGLVVATSKPATVAGRIVVEGGAPELGPSKLSVRTVPDETERGRMMFGSQAPAVVRDDMSFQLDGQLGPRLLMVTGPPRGWIVKSVTYRGDDVTDTAVEFQSSTDPRLLEVTLTNRGAVITGRVLGDDGKESFDAYVVLLPGDVTRWRPSLGMPRFAPKADGTFTIGPVRAGEYVIAAVSGLSMARVHEPSTRAEVVAQIAKGGERIVLVENDKHSIDLRITKLQ